MQIVILAAGRGIRMGKLTDNLPKPMLTIKGRPILEYTLANLPESASEIIFIIGYKGDLIKSHFGGEYKGKKISYGVQENLSGTADAVHRVRNLLKGKFLVLNGDDLYYKPDLEKLILNDLGILTKEVDKPERFGIVKTDKEGNLLEIIEKPEKYVGNLANIGAYLLNENFFSYEPVKLYNKEFYLPQTMAKMAKDHKIKVEKAEFWQPVGYPEDILKAEKIIHLFHSGS